LGIWRKLDSWIINSYCSLWCWWIEGNWTFENSKNHFLLNSSGFSPWSYRKNEKKSDFVYSKNKIVEVDETNNVFNKYVTCVYVKWKWIWYSCIHNNICVSSLWVKFGNMEETGQLNNRFVLPLMMLMNRRKLNIWKFDKQFFHLILRFFFHYHRNKKKSNFVYSKNKILEIDETQKCLQGIFYVCFVKMKYMNKKLNKEILEWMRKIFLGFIS
jgi:hypothetical protein